MSIENLESELARIEKLPVAEQLAALDQVISDLEKQLI